MCALFHMLILLSIVKIGYNNIHWAKKNSHYLWFVVVLFCIRLKNGLWYYIFIPSSIISRKSGCTSVVQLEKDLFHSEIRPSLLENCQVSVPFGTKISQFLPCLVKYYSLVPISLDNRGCTLSYLLILDNPLMTLDSDTPNTMWTSCCGTTV